MFSPTESRRSSRFRRGMSILYVVIMLIVLIAMVSLAVDYGRVKLARAQLQTAADAAARAGASGLPVSTAATLDRATDVAEENVCLETTVSFNNAEDLDFGVWNRSTHTFTQ